MIPLSNCTFNISCLFNGLVYYDQWSRIIWWHLLLVMLGALITVSGVILISIKSTGVNNLMEEEAVVVNTVMDDSDDTLSEHTSLLGPKHRTNTNTYT